MRWVLLCVVGAIFVAGVKTLHAAHPAASDADVLLSGPTFKVGGLKFIITSRWQSVPVEKSAPAGEWRVPLPHDQEGEGGDVVVLYFGPGVGGGAKDNIDAWADAMSSPDSHPV